MTPPSQPHLLAKADRSFAAATEFATALANEAETLLNGRTDPTLVWAAIVHKLHHDVTEDDDTDIAVFLHNTIVALAAAAVRAAQQRLDQQAHNNQNRP